MGLFDALKDGKGKASKAKPAVVAVSVGKEPDTMTAASRIMKAIENKDVEALDDALRLHAQLCEDEEGEDEEEEDDEEE